MAVPTREPSQPDPDATTVAGSAGRTVTAGVLALRAVLAALAWWGLIDALNGDLGQLKYFSQVTTLFVALAATAAVLGAGLRSDAWWRALDWVRGAAATYAVVTAVIYQVLLSGNLDATSSMLEHAIVPAVALGEWLLVGPTRGRQPWWTPLTWLVVPVGYLAVYFNVRNRSGEPLYPFLDPGAASFWRWVVIMLAVFLVTGLIVWALGLARGRPAATSDSR